MVEPSPLPRRLCSKCGESKLITAFYRQKNCKDGRRADCSDCCKKRAGLTYRADPAKSKEDRRAYYLANKSHLRQCNKDWLAANPEKARAGCKAWREANPGRKKAGDQKWQKENADRKFRSGRDGHLRRKYGITLAEYEHQLAHQGGACAICRSDDPGGPYGHSFVVDHDHVTNVVRGLLCFNCNTALGMLSDSADVARAAASYLDNPATSLVIVPRARRA